MISTERATVTVVDDEPYSRDILVRAARLWNYECQSAASAEQAVELLEQQPTPVVVTDLRMPGRGGFWLVREIHRRWPDIGVIVVTAGDDRDSARECLRAGAHRYFLKPIRFDEFQHALASTLRAYRQHQRRERARQKLERAVRRATGRQRRTFLSGIDSLVRALEERDAYTAGHSQRVSELSMRLGRAVRLDPRQLRKLHLAARLHDIGKVGLPEAILNKAGRLTPEEMAVVQQHPVIGQRILEPIIRNTEVLAAIRGHHERLDGTGYPDGLMGGAISLLTRIITVADCFDALTSTRAYRAAMAPEEALRFLKAGTGTQFDPELVPVFVQIICHEGAGQPVSEPSAV